MLLIVVFLCIFGCNKKNAHEKEVENNQRRAVMNEWFLVAEKVANESKDPEALKIISQIRNSSFIAKPLGENLDFQAIDDIPKTPYRLAILPLLDSDTAYGDAWKEEIQKSALASFSPYSNNVGVIMLKGRKDFSQRMRGIIFLHEGKHMMITISGKLKDIENNDEKIALAINELEVFDFETRLMSKLGGEAYRNLIKKGIPVVMERFAKDGGMVFKRPWFPNELKEIFGAEMDLNKDYGSPHF